MICDKCGGEAGVCTDCGCVTKSTEGAPNTTADTSVSYLSSFIGASGATIQLGIAGWNNFFGVAEGLVEDKTNSCVVAVMRGQGDAIRFSAVNQTYTAMHCNSENFSLTLDTTACEFTFQDNQAQHTFVFNDKGRLISNTNAGGKGSEVTSTTADGNPSEIIRSAVVDSESVTSKLNLSYIASGENQGLLESVTSSETVKSTSTNLRRTLYSYYETADSHGNPSDLKTVTQQIFEGGVWVDHETNYNRYYQSGETGGFEHGLKYYVGPDAFERLSNDPQVPDPLTASDEKVAQYADNYYEYDSDQRATKASIQGGLLTYTYAYTVSTFANGENNWHLKTVTTNLDGSEEIVFSNHLAEVMLRELTDGTDRWIDYTKYDSDVRVILQSTPAAIDMSGTPYDQTQADLNVQLNGSSGLIHITDYYASTTATETTAGGVQGYVAFTKIKEGNSGTEIKQSQTKYFKRSAEGMSAYPVAEQTIYRDTAGSEPITTKFEYVWYTDQTQIKQTTTKFPIVPTTQNGTGLQESKVVVYDLYSRPVWSKNARGFITYTAYNDLTDAVVQQIQDVDMSQMTGYRFNPGWTTLTGGGLQQITDIESDTLGRTTQVLGPSHDIDGQSVRTASLIVY